MNTDMTNTGIDTQSLQPNTYVNAEKSPNKDNYLIERNEIINTPFTTIIKDKQKFITFGQYRISPDLQPHEEPLQWLNDHMWEIIVIMASITFELNQQQLKQTEIKDHLPSQEAPKIN